MSHDLTGKTALITGATRGIGLATARAFSAAGARLVLFGRSRDALSRAASEAGSPDATAVVCDMGNGEEINRAFADALASVGRIDVLVNNAGISGEAAPFLKMKLEAWDTMLAVNLTGPFLLAQAASRAMAASGGGVILHTASIAGIAVDGPFAHYSASKAGLLALTRSMAVELAPHGIRVNSVSPGYTRTEMTLQYFGAEAERCLSSEFDRVPIRRLVETHEVADAFVFLASDAASGITGTNLIVDGGLTANLYIMETLPVRGD